MQNDSRLIGNYDLDVRHGDTLQRSASERLSREANAPSSSKRATTDQNGRITSEIEFLPDGSVMSNKFTYHQSGKLEEHSVAELKPNGAATSCRDIYSPDGSLNKSVIFKSQGGKELFQRREIVAGRLYSSYERTVENGVTRNSSNSLDLVPTNLDGTLQSFSLCKTSP